MLLKAFVHSAAIFGLCAGAASAQDRAGRFAERDANRDGVLTPHEYQTTGGHPGNFRSLDANGDGLLSRSEFVGRDGAVEAPESVRSESATYPAYPDDPNVLTKVEFEKLDRNHDRVLTKGEWRGNGMAFRKLDENRDGYVSAAEYGVAATPVGVLSGTTVLENRFRDKDLDRNGLLTPREYGHPQTFDRVDSNDDGGVSLQELLNPPAANSLQGRFDEADRNDDGWVSRREWAGNQRSFRTLDRNRDGRVSRNEFE